MLLRDRRCLRRFGRPRRLLGGAARRRSDPSLGGIGAFGRRIVSRHKSIPSSVRPLSLRRCAALRPPQSCPSALRGKRPKLRGYPAIWGCRPGKSVASMHQARIRRPRKKKCLSVSFGGAAISPNSGHKAAKKKSGGVMDGVVGWFERRGEIPLAPPPRLREYGPLADDPDRPDATIHFRPRSRHHLRARILRFPRLGEHAAPSAAWRLIRPIPPR